MTLIEAMAAFYSTRARLLWAVSLFAFKVEAGLKNLKILRTILEIYAVYLTLYRLNLPLSNITETLF